MIYIGNIHDIDILHRDWDKKYAIVRSYKNQTCIFEQKAILSPSTELFFTYRKLIKYCKWNKDSVDKYYVPKFLQQMQGREEKDALNQLYVMSKTQNILLVCFCENEDLCHRSIIAGLLSGAGAEVQTSSGHNYDKYWDMYHNLCN